MTNCFAGLCQDLALFEPELMEFAHLCKKLAIFDNGDTLEVLDQERGQLLEHCQLRKDPRYKKV
jgi:hypothetical protein